MNYGRLWMLACARLSPLVLGATLLAGGSDSLADAAPPSDAEAAEAAQDAYVYAYPMVLMEVTRRALTNVEAPGNFRAPMNQFVHVPTIVDPSFTDVVRPNADTLYSSLWFDVSSEPLVLSVPDSGGRYYLLEMLDMWTDVFASPGSRTTGNGAQTIALVGPDWNGTPPAGADVLRAPTRTGWIIGRVQTNGPADYDDVHAFQAGLTATPLSAWGTRYVAPKGTVDPTGPKAAPVDVVDHMDAATFFGTFSDALKSNPPHANDYPILHRMRRLGLDVSKPLDGFRDTPSLRTTLDEAMPVAHERVLAQVQTGASWASLRSPGGAFGRVNSSPSSARSEANSAQTELGNSGTASPRDAISASRLAMASSPYSARS